jgi:hypothetical protein
MRTRHGFGIGVLAAAIAAAATFVGAQPASFDHLACYQIKDSVRRGSASADLVPGTPPFLAALGCKIALPAREYCTRVAKENLDPPPVGNVDADEPGDYFCYKVACPRAADLRGASVTSADQFGARSIFLRKPTRLCVPASRATPTPTMTPLVPTITPSGGNHDPGCSFDGVECQGSCNTTGRCVWDPAQARCICPAVFDADCGHSINQCGGQLCFGPDEQCVPVPGATPFGNCRCAPRPTATATFVPCNNGIFPQCELGSCGPFSACFNFGSFCGCEPPTPTPATTPTP